MAGDHQAEIAASVAALKDLGPAYDQGLAEGLVERIGAEIDPGVPWTHASGDGVDLLLALKSGNFGATDFFPKAFQMLDGERR